MRGTPVPCEAHRQHLLARGPYQGAIVPPIKDANPAISTRVLALAREATIDRVRFDRDLGHSAPPRKWGRDPRLGRGPGSPRGEVLELDGVAHQLAHMSHVPVFTAVRT